uniref:Uncharacterized protein n=1 Tax=Oryza meridionalis TaxID=40149 RepID=A0A0E0F621_9ORYZ
MDHRNLTMRRSRYSAGPPKENESGWIPASATMVAKEDPTTSASPCSWWLPLSPSLCFIGARCMSLVVASGGGDDEGSQWRRRRGGEPAVDPSVPSSSLIAAGDKGGREGSQWRFLQHCHCCSSRPAAEAVERGVGTVVILNERNTGSSDPAIPRQERSMRPNSAGINPSRAEQAL